MTGSLALVLHAHLPYVRHPEHEEFLEEYWYYEAAIECYLPLLGMLRRLAGEGVPCRLTLDLSPPLVEMMRDPLLTARLARRFDNLLELCAKEKSRRGAADDDFRLARFYDQRLRRMRTLFERFCQRDLAGGFARLAAEGRIELITSAATHGFLPFLAVNPAAVRAQIAVGVAAHTRHFGRAPRGIWLPECAYVPALDPILAACGLSYFCVETHGVLHASPPPRHGALRPLATPAGRVAFGRDPASAKQVWSSCEGYPGDPWYREFYRDLAYQRPRAYIRPHLPAGLPFATGLKYHRVTGRTEDKAPYRRGRALQRAQLHAEHFVGERVRQLEAARAAGVPAPLAVAPYDAELFGHWWFEGPDWLERVFRAAHGRLRTVTLSEYLDEAPRPDTARLAFSSWGEHGYGGVWLNPQTDWIYPKLHRMANSMADLARAFPDPSLLERRALNQAARELLLAQASDWPFLIRRGGAPDYAAARLHTHLANFSALERALRRRGVRARLVGPLEQAFCPFPDLDYRVYGA